MKRHLLAVGSIFLAIALILTACGGSGAAMDSASSTASIKSTSPAAPVADGMYMADMAESQEAEMAEPDTGGAPSMAPEEQERKIIKNCWMNLETTAFDTALDTLNQLIEEAGGYVESQNVGGRSLNSSRDYYERSATVTARVPAEKLDQVTTAVGNTFNIVSKEESVQDITDSYYDAQTRLENMEIQEQRLLELLEQAESLEDIIALENALANVRSEIESLTGRLRRMDSQVAYSSLTMEIQEVVKLTEIQQKPKTFGEKLGESFRRSGENITDTLQGLIFFLVEDGPVLLIWVLLIALVVWIIRKLIRRLQRNKPARQPFSLVPPAGGPGIPPQPNISAPSPSKEEEKKP